MKIKDMKMYRFELFMTAASYEYIRKLAYSENIKMSELIRRWIYSGLNFAKKYKSRMLVLREGKSPSGLKYPARIAVYVNITTYTEMFHYASEFDVPMTRMVRYIVGLGAALNGICLNSEENFSVDRKEFEISWKQKAPCVDL